MSRLRSASALVLTALILLGSTAATHGLSASSDRGQGPAGTARPHPASLTPELERSPLYPPMANTFVGVDGLTYEFAPSVAFGTTGRAFIGQDFDAACWYGAHLHHGLRQLAKLARVIEDSGRHVVWTVAPNKSSVTTGELPADMPHGRCSRRAITQQNRILDRFSDPRFIPMRASLERQSARGANVYWHYDTHWTTVAGAQYAEAVATMLNPRIAALQRYRTAPSTISVDLGEQGFIDQMQESGKVRIPTTPVRVRPAGDTTVIDLDTLINPDISWRTGPAARTWRGNTLLLGDSFTYRSLSVLMPLFRRGHFMWLNVVDDDDVLKAIAKSDTVVLELVQRYVGVSRHVQAAFRRSVRDALSDYDSRLQP